jgi:hypothetical protein
VRAAQAMRRKLIELNRDWEAEAHAAGKVFRAVRMGIGINAGECCVGNYGSQQHFNYSLLGDPVNLTSRLESLSKIYGIDLLIGEETAARLVDRQLIEIDLVAVKGKTRVVRVYTLSSEQIEEQQMAWHSALLNAYRRQDWPAPVMRSPSVGNMTRAWLSSMIYMTNASAFLRLIRRVPIGTACSWPARNSAKGRGACTSAGSRSPLLPPRPYGCRRQPPPTRRSATGYSRQPSCCLRRRRATPSM